MTENNKLLSFGNITTIVNSIIVVIAGYLFAFLVSIFGVGLPFTESQLASFLTALVFAVFSYYNARYHNTFWDSEEDTLNIPLNDLDDHQIKAIKNFIEYCSENIDVKEDDKSEISETDPNDSLSSDIDFDGDYSEGEDET